jgi:TolB-like protein
VINEARQTAASGSSQPSRSASNPADRKNKIAVLPFQFITNEPGIQTDQMSKQLQANCAGSLRKNTSNIIVQDPLTTNRLLAKNNIDINDPAAVDPQELAVVLGVEYVMFGTVDVINKGTISTGSAATTYKDKEKHNRDKNSKETKASGTAVTSNNAITSTNYDTKVALNIYTDQGSTYYSKSRKAFGNGLDSYSGTLDYLIKRTPVGTKSR